MKFQQFNSPELSIIKDVFNKLPSYLELDINSIPYIVESYIYSIIKEQYNPEITDSIDCEYQVRYDKKNGYYKSWYQDGVTKMEECYYLNDKLEGKYKRWWENCISLEKPMKECNYSNGEKDGLYVEYWFGNGNKYIEYNYSKDKIDGLFTQWYSNGQKSYECNYSNDKLDGSFTKYRFNNNISKLYECFYSDNNRNGDYKEYEEDGSLRKHLIYKDDKIINTILDNSTPVNNN